MKNARENKAREILSQAFCLLNHFLSLDFICRAWLGILG